MQCSGSGAADSQRVRMGHLIWAAARARKGADPAGAAVSAAEAAAGGVAGEDGAARADGHRQLAQQPLRALPPQRLLPHPALLQPRHRVRRHAVSPEPQLLQVPLQRFQPTFLITIEVSRESTVNQSSVYV